MLVVEQNANLALDIGHHGLRAGDRPDRRRGTGRSRSRATRASARRTWGSDRGINLFVSQILNGIGNGVVYASVALALVLIYRTTGLLNFAQGEMALFSTYLVVEVHRPPACRSVLAILLSMVLSFIAGAIIERVLIRPVEVGREPAERRDRHAGHVPRDQLARASSSSGRTPRRCRSMFPSGTWKLGDISDPEGDHRPHRRALRRVRVCCTCCSSARRSASSCGPSRPTPSRAGCSASTPASCSCSAGRSRRRSAPWPGRWSRPSAPASTPA